jgi:hypothetical protein
MQSRNAFVGRRASAGSVSWLESLVSKGNETHKESFVTGLFSGIELPVTARPSGKTRDVGVCFRFMA